MILVNRVTPPRADIAPSKLYTPGVTHGLFSMQDAKNDAVGYFLDIIYISMRL